MSDHGRSDHEPEEIPGFLYNTIGDNLPLIIEKWFKIGGEGVVEFHGYDCHEVIEILTALSSLNADAVRYRPE